MLKVNWPTQRTRKGAPGKSSPADFAFTCPRPPLRSFTKECSNEKAPLKPLRQQRGLCRFFGANSVASALGIRSGATPCGLIHPNIQRLNARSKPDILTLLGLGHFYFALTGRPYRARFRSALTRGSTLPLRLISAPSPPPNPLSYPLGSASKTVTHVPGLKCHLCARPHKATSLSLSHRISE